MTICLDPGHGGRDPGARAAVCERDLALLIARRAKEPLVAAGHSVVWTRCDNRSCPGINERPRTAARAGAGLLVSIHANAGPPGAQGVEAWHRAGCDRDARLARRLLAALSEECPRPLKLRGVFPDSRNRHGRLGVLRGCYRLGIPAVLIECGFLTNAGDLEMMQSVEFGLAVGRAIGRVAEGAAVVLHSPTNT